MASRVNRISERHLVPILRSIWAKHRGEGHHDKHLMAALDAMTGFYECLDFTKPDGSYPVHLPRSKVRELQGHVDQLLRHYAWLTDHYIRKRELLFNMVPKFHLLWHLGQEAAELSPRISWCYANEDFVGRLATIGMSARHGLPAASRSRPVCTKYILGLALRLKHRSG